MKPLTIDLVPSTAWFSNLRSELSAKEWDLVRHKTYAAAGNHCECCGGAGRKHAVECHEQWQYNNLEGTRDDEGGRGLRLQTLTGTIALCPACHEVAHFGLAMVRGNSGRALKHLMRVNQLTNKEATLQVNLAMQTWEQRSRQAWRLDARWLLDFVPLSEKTKNKILAHAKGTEVVASTMAPA